VYGEAPSNEANGGTVPLERTAVPEGELPLPAFHDTVRTLDQVVDVDFYVPGCPPTPKVIANALQALLRGELPPKGAVLAGSRALCYECPLSGTKPEKPVLADVKRVWEVVPDPDTCLLAQGILCLGPVTRGGCEALCIGANMPCTGCFGPLDRVRDYGAKGISAVASLLDANEPDELEALAEKVPDLIGTFYRYSLPASLLRRRTIARTNGGSR
jgi:F420-non-reducing hydrogenase small subunit